MTKQPEKIALIDLDGTIADYDQNMRRELLKTLSPVEHEQYGELIKSGDIYETRHDWLNARADLIKKQTGFWRNLPLIADGYAIYQLLGQLGYRRVILTKGPKRTTSAWTEKLEWCQKHVPHASVTITQDKGLVYGKVLFDDYPPYIERWLEWRPRGKVLMLDTLYNQGFEHPQVLRITSSSFFSDVKIFLGEL
jgi:5'-nucleotidase